MTLKTFLLLTALVLTQGLGDIFLSRGMKEFGEITLQFSTIPTLLVFLLTSPWIYLGVGILILSLVLYLTSISRLDLSYVLPIHASTYIVNAVLARFLLGEHIGLSRGLSTLLITVGVLIVSLGDVSQSVSHRTGNIDGKIRNLPLFIAPLGLTIPKAWLAVLAIAVSDASGDVLLAWGMRQAGRVEKKSWREGKALIGRIISNPAILGGIICQSIAFISFITALSWADISFVRPATALTYVFSLMGAKFLLKETINRRKLIGIALVGSGILIHR
jgi:transporter family protein